MGLQMGRALAENQTHAGCSRSEVHRAGSADLSAEDGGCALGVLGAVAAIGRVKERNAAFDQGEVMDIIEGEVDAARACA